MHSPEISPKSQKNQILSIFIELHLLYLAQSYLITNLYIIELVSNIFQENMLYHLKKCLKPVLLCIGLLLSRIEQDIKDEVQ
jgi:hypothetical protein